MAGKQTRFSELLAAAIAERDLPLDRLTARLKAAGKPVSVATLSYWQTGRSLPTRAKSMETLVELEKILWLNPGTLTLALPDSMSRWDPLRVLPGTEKADELITEVTRELAQTWTKLSIWDRIYIGADHTESHMVTRQILRSKVDGADSILMILHQDAAEDVMPTVESVFGYELAEITHLAEDQTAMARFNLPKPVPEGTIITCEHVVRWGKTTTPSFRLERSTADAMTSLVLEAEFDCDLPRHFEAFMRPWLESDTDRHVTPVLPQGRWVRSVLTHARPGVHGITWHW